MSTLKGPNSFATFVLPLLAGGFAFGAVYAFTSRNDANSITPKEAVTEQSRPRANAASIHRTIDNAAEGMTWIPGGRFVMGSDEIRSNEAPAHEVQVDGFWIDPHEVTNEQFARFVDSTGYVTTAEKAPDWEEMRKQLPAGTPKPDESLLVPGSLVFTPPSEAVPLDDVSKWWSWVPGANWRQPEGPGSSLEGRSKHPVVHVSWDDAQAYCEWAGKRLPTEAEWEYAARGGLADTRFNWGNQTPSEENGPTPANIWQGDFPHRNLVTDGFERTAPVGSFSPNGYGLYDTAGNVWEWCADWYRADEFARRSSSEAELCRNPVGPGSSWNPDEPLSPSRVTKGGSFLCHVTYCESYRPAARRGTATDTGMSHIGFRCASDGPPLIPDVSLKETDD